MANISDEDISIIKHARKSFLFNNGKPWIKNNNGNLFDVTMGSYDGADICELVGLFMLNHLEKLFGKENIGLYRDDRFGNHEKQVSTFGRQNKKRTS